MKILFVHQNFPAQFRHLAPALVARGHSCAALTHLANAQTTSIQTWRYKFEKQPLNRDETRLGYVYTEMSDRGTIVARAARSLRDSHGYTPDLIIGHSGWGETLFLKEIWPNAKLLTYAEFYFQSQGADIGFDPEFSKRDFVAELGAVARSAYLCQSIVQSDAALTPTQWQASCHPKALQPMINVIFEGVDCARLTPNPEATFTLPNGKVLRAGDEVLSFINRNLEPYRGYHSFMRALPEVMAARPEAEVVIIGDSGSSYGKPPENGSWKDIFLSEVQDRIDLSRVHFMGRVTHNHLIDLYHVARVHAYLTYPFVVSWSCVETLAAGGLVVGSRTPSVEEVITHGENGLLVDFFDIKAWSTQLIECLAHPERYTGLRAEARRRASALYDLNSVCLPRQIALVESLSP